jgi:MarR family transcriptional regulator for hemolysin
VPTTPDIEKLGLLLSDTARVWRTKLDQRLRPLGLSQGKWTTLVHLSRGADKLTQKEIAARIGIEEPTLAGILNRLQQDGWVKRKSARHDRRCKTVHLQRRTAAVLDRIFSTARDLRHELLADIPERDLLICARVLARIRERAEEVSAGTSEQRVNGISPRRSKAMNEAS